MLLLQFKLPDEIIEQFKSASNEEGKLQAIEKYANDLPIVTRTYIAGKIQMFKYHPFY